MIFKFGLTFFFFFFFFLRFGNSFDFVTMVNKIRGQIKIVYENYTFVSIESINISYSRCGNFVEKIIQREGSKKN